jgi:hypothetical protein
VLPTLDTAHRELRPSATKDGEAGYALTELLLVSSLLVIVLGAILMLGEASQRIAPRETERAIVIRDAQGGMHRMTRELREAYNVVSPAPGASGAVFDAWVPTTGGERRVSYECNGTHPSEPATFTRCIRYDVAANGTKSNPQMVIDWIVNGQGQAGSTLPVFVRGSAPTTDYVKATVEVGARGERKTGYSSKVLLEDGFYMRNLDAN